MHEGKTQLGGPQSPGLDVGLWNSEEQQHVPTAAEAPPYSNHERIASRPQIHETRTDLVGIKPRRRRREKKPAKTDGVRSLRFKDSAPSAPDPTTWTTSAATPPGNPSNPNPGAQQRSQTQPNKSASLRSSEPINVTRAGWGGRKRGRGADGITPHEGEGTYGAESGGGRNPGAPSPSEPLASFRKTSSWAALRRSLCSRRGHRGGKSSDRRVTAPTGRPRSGDRTSTEAPEDGQKIRAPSGGSITCGDSAPPALLKLLRGGTSPGPAGSDSEGRWFAWDG